MSAALRFPPVTWTRSATILLAHTAVFANLGTLVTEEHAQLSEPLLATKYFKTKREPRARCTHWCLGHETFQFIALWETSDAEMEDGPLLWKLMAQRTPSTIPLLSGATGKSITLQEGRLVLTNKKPNCPPIGRRTSRRFVLECGTAQQQDSWSFAKVPTHCTHLSLTEHTELFHWAVTSGSLLLVQKAHYSRIAIKKGSTL